MKWLALKEWLKQQPIAQDPLILLGETIEWLRTNDVNVRDLIEVLEIHRAKVGFPCYVGPPYHPRGDECWVCHKSVCIKHSERVFTKPHGEEIFFSFCEAHLDQIDESALMEVAKEMVVE